MQKITEPSIYERSDSGDRVGTQKDKPIVQGINASNHYTLNNDPRNRAYGVLIGSGKCHRGQERTDIALKHYPDSTADSVSVVNRRRVGCGVDSQRVVYVRGHIT